jgi:hypothetical protein
MKRSRFAPAALVVASLAVAPAVFAQTKTAPAKPAVAAVQGPPGKAAPAQAPATPVKFYKPIKGPANIEVIQGTGKRVGSDIVTVLKIRNTSSGSIGLLKVDEYWYNKKLAVVSGDTQHVRKPFNPGDVVEITMKAPVKPDLYKSQYAFSHAGGEIKVKPVKKFE